MGFDFGAAIKIVFPKKKKRNTWDEKGHKGADTREYVQRATRTIKKSIKEPDELPLEERVPAVKEVLNNSP